MLLGFLIFIAATIGVVTFISNVPSGNEKPAQESLATSEGTVIEKVFPTLPPETAQPTPSSVTPTVLGTSDTKTAANGLSIDKTSLYSLINAHRKENGLSELKVHTSLEQSSNKKLQEMINEKYWQHTNREGQQSWQLFVQSGYHYANAGENLSFGNNSAWTVFNAWKESAEHNTQMLTAEYEHMGLATDCTTYQEAGSISCVAVLHLANPL